MAKKLYIPTQIHRKIRTFVTAYSFEVCMEATVQRLQNGSYVLTDVFPIPQINSAAFVESDDDRYPQFIAKLMQEKGLDYTDTIRCFIHSHPGMSVTPSGHDRTKFEGRDLTSVDNFYLMLITNQKGDYHCEVGEWITWPDSDEKELLVEKITAEIRYIKDKSFLEECKTMVKQKPVTPVAPVRYSGGVTTTNSRFGQRPSTPATTANKNVGGTTRKNSNGNTTKKDDLTIYTSVASMGVTGAVYNVMVEKALVKEFSAVEIRKNIDIKQMHSDLVDAQNKPYADVLIMPHPTYSDKSTCIGIVIKRKFEKYNSGSTYYTLYIKEEK